MAANQKDLYRKRQFGKFDKHRVDKIRKYLPRKEGLTFLDVGCGEGHFIDEIKDFNYNYVGIDLSPEQVAKAKKRGLNVIEHDISKRWPFDDNSIDIVFCSEIIEHVFDTDAAISEVHRVLKNDGRLILTTPNIASLGSRFKLFFLGRRPSQIENRARPHDSGHIRAFDLNDLKTIFAENNLKVVHVTGRDFYMPFFKHERPYLGKVNVMFSNLFPKLSAGFIIVCKKIAK